MFPLQLVRLRSTKLHSQSHHDNLLFSVPTFDRAGLWITCPPRCNGQSPWHVRATTEHLQVKQDQDQCRYEVDWQLHITLPCITISTHQIETSVIKQKIWISSFEMQFMEQKESRDVMQCANYDKLRIEPPLWISNGAATFKLIIGLGAQKKIAV